MPDSPLLPQSLLGGTLRHGSEVGNAGREHGAREALQYVRKLVSGVFPASAARLGAVAAGGSALAVGAGQRPAAFGAVGAFAFGPVCRGLGPLLEAVLRIRGKPAVRQQRRQILAAE